MKRELALFYVSFFLSGEVKYVVVPNKHHVFWSIAFLKEYPNSYLIATYGVKHDEKFNKYVDAYFTNDGLLYTNNNSTNKSFEWPFKQINYYCFYSVEFLDEVAFYHSSSSTLILTDLAFNISEIGENPIKAEGYLFRFYLWLVDGYRQSCVSKPFKYFFRKNIQSVLHDFDQLMNLYENFDRLIMAHGTAIHHKGYDTLKLGTYKFAADLYQEENRLKNASSNYTKWGLFVVAAISIYILSQFLSS